MTPLAEWGTFYEVLGSASAALTGLQFITIALLADMPIRDPGETEASDAFATPTIVHFTSALFLAALGAAPWHILTGLACLWTVIGLAGLVYTLVVIRRMRSQVAYHPVLEGWAFHAILPVLAYSTLTASGPLALRHPTAALAAVAGAALLLLSVGVHNAWDNVSFLALRKRKQNQA